MIIHYWERERFPRSSFLQLSNIEFDLVPNFVHYLPLHLCIEMITCGPGSLIGSASLEVSVPICSYRISKGRSYNRIMVIAAVVFAQYVDQMNLGTVIKGCDGMADEVKSINCHDAEAASDTIKHNAMTTQQHWRRHRRWQLR